MDVNVTKSGPVEAQGLPPRAGPAIRFARRSGRFTVAPRAGTRTARPTGVTRAQRGQGRAAHPAHGTRAPRLPRFWCPFSHKRRRSLCRPPPFGTELKAAAPRSLPTVSFAALSSTTRQRPRRPPRSHRRHTAPRHRCSSSPAAARRHAPPRRPRRGRGPRPARRPRWGALAVDCIDLRAVCQRRRESMSPPEPGLQHGPPITSVLSLGSLYTLAAPQGGVWWRAAQPREWKKSCGRRRHPGCCMACPQQGAGDGVVVLVRREEREERFHLQCFRQQLVTARGDCVWGIFAAAGGGWQSRRQLCFKWPFLSSEVRQQGRGREGIRRGAGGAIALGGSTRTAT